MARLILLVPRAGMIDIGQTIEGQCTVALEARGRIGRDALGAQRIVLLVARLGAHRIHQTSPSGHKLDPRVPQALPQPAVKTLMKISYPPELLLEPALIDFGLIGGEG